MDRSNIKKIIMVCSKKDAFIEKGKSILEHPIHFHFKPTKWENKV
jgi:hypothetical protein